MGKETYYCYRCQSRVTSDDLEKGGAKKLGNRIACVECADGLVAPRPAPDVESEDPTPVDVPTVRDDEKSVIDSSIPFDRLWARVALKPDFVVAVSETSGE